jgi:hypothetical protein
MIKVSLLFALLILNFATMSSAQDSAFDTFLTKFDYETRADMKIDSKKLITLLAEKKAVLVDNRHRKPGCHWGDPDFLADIPGRAGSIRQSQGNKLFMLIFITFVISKNIYSSVFILTCHILDI